jgi:hypothetical protein
MFTAILLSFASCRTFHFIPILHSNDPVNFETILDYFDDFKFTITTSQLLESYNNSTDATKTAA